MESIVEITFENAQQYLIDESHQRPVVIDFWADWCAPCKQLMPILENLAREYAGQFLLAKLNADELQTISQQFGVRSLPTVMVMKDGQPVDGFTGAQPESAVREMLDKYLPKPWDAMLAQAKDLMAEGQFNDALPLLKTANNDSGARIDILLTYAHALLELGRCDEASEILDAVPMADQDHYFQQLKAMLELKQAAAETPEIQALQEQLAQSPEDLAVNYQLAVQLSQVNRYSEALELLYFILKRDREYSDNAARRAYLDILKSLGPKDTVAIEYQRKLYSLLY